jgi:hypothetical protein
MIYNTTKELITSVPVPAQTRTYKPVSHSQLIDLTLNGIEKAGFTLDNEMYSSANIGQIANGRFSISNVADSEMQLQIGWQNSYDKSLTLKFAIGTRIFICQNGSVSGDFGAYKRKHVGEIQSITPQKITDYISQAAETFTIMQQQREQMKQIEVTRRTKAELIGRMLIEKSIITSTQVSLITKELQAPTFDYGAKDTLWELYQFTTQALKETHPAAWIPKHMAAHNFFVNESGAIVSPLRMDVSQVPTMSVENILEQLSLDFTTN